MIGVICHPEPVPPLHDMFNKLDNARQMNSQRGLWLRRRKDLDSLLTREADDLFQRASSDEAEEARNRVANTSRDCKSNQTEPCRLRNADSLLFAGLQYREARH